MRIKLLCFSLLLALLLPMLCACGDGDVTTPAGTTSGDGDGEVTTAPMIEGPLVDNIDLSGVTIRVAQNVELYRDIMESGAYSPLLFSKGPDDAEYDKYATNAVFAEVYNRNSEIAEKTGLEVLYSTVTYERAWDNIINDIEGFALSDMEDAPDIVSHITGGIISCGLRGYLYNAYEDEAGTNYFDFTHSSWYYDRMKQSTWSDSCIHMLCGDYWIEMVRCASPVLVNISMYDELFTVEGGIEALYRDIDEGWWSMDDLFERAAMAYVPKGISSDFNPDDIFGVVSNSYRFMSLVETSGLHPNEIGEDGKIKQAGAETLTEIHNFIDKMIAWQNDDSVWFNYDKMVTPETGCIHKFAEGGALFTIGNFVASMEGALLQDADDVYGVLPIPKHDYDDRGAFYRVNVSNAISGGILINSDRFSACSAFLQMQTEGSREVMRLYFEEGLQLKNNMSNSVGQVRMLDYVREGVKYSDGLKLAEPENVEGYLSYNTIVRNCVINGTNTFSSDWAAGFNAREEAIRQAYESYRKFE